MRGGGPCSSKKSRISPVTPTEQKEEKSKGWKTGKEERRVVKREAAEVEKEGETGRRERKRTSWCTMFSFSPRSLSAGVKSVEMWRRWECGLCDAREKVEQESKLGDFEIQSIKLLAFRRAVAGVVRPLLHPLAPQPLPPHPLSRQPRLASPRSSSHPLFLLCMSVPLLSSRSLLRPFSRVLFPSFPAVALPLKCIPMYHHSPAHSTHPPPALEISTCVHTHTNQRHRASLFLFLFSLLSSPQLFNVLLLLLILLLPFCHCCPFEARCVLRQR